MLSVMLVDERKSLAFFPTPSSSFGDLLRVSQEALRSVIISQQLLGTREVVLFHHTDCGMLTFKDDVLRTKLKESVKADIREAVAPAVDQISFLPFSDLGKPSVQLIL